MLRGLPTDALVRSTPEERNQEKWTVETELLAQVLEEVSLVATHNMGRKKPLKVPRPDHLKKPARRQVDVGAGDTNVVEMDAYRRGINVLRQSTVKT